MVADIGNKHKCTNCPQTFFSLRNREIHVKKAHMPAEEVQYRCAGCDSNFVTHKDFTAHRKIVHEKDGSKIKYSCRIPDCGFYTEKRDELAVHVHADHPNQVKSTGWLTLDNVILFFRFTFVRRVAVTSLMKKI